MKTSTHAKIAVVTALLVLMVVAAPADILSRFFPPEPEENLSPWKSGAATVTLNDDGTLVVKGAGAMEDCYYNRNFVPCPWRSFRDSITGLVIEEGVTHIGAEAFASFSRLKSVTIPSSVISIGHRAFAGMTSIVVTENNVHYSSEDGVLFNKDKTTLLQYPLGRQGAYTIPGSVTSIEDFAFSGSAALKSVTIHNSVTSIGKHAFSHSGLVSVTIPGSVTFIGDIAFERTDLTSVIIEEGVKYIGLRMFLGCENLTSVTIPSSVTFIGGQAFAVCTGLASVIVKNPNPPELEDPYQSVFDRINLDSACLYVPKGSMDAYRGADGWKDFDCIKPIASDDVVGTPWLVLTVLTALLLSAVIFVIIKKSGQKRGFQCKC